MNVKTHLPCVNTNFDSLFQNRHPNGELIPLRLKIKNALYRQTFSPVLWVSDAQAMESAGVDTFIELGPGNVLSGLTKRICKGKKVCPIQKVTDIPKGLETLRGDLE